MTRYLAVAAVLAVLWLAARRYRTALPPRPEPLTLVERYGAEMLMGDYEDDPKDAA